MFRWNAPWRPHAACSIHVVEWLLVVLIWVSRSFLLACVGGVASVVRPLGQTVRFVVYVIIELNAFAHVLSYDVLIVAILGCKRSSETDLTPFPIFLGWTAPRLHPHDLWLHECWRTARPQTADPRLRYLQPSCAVCSWLGCYAIAGFSHQDAD